MHSSSKANPKKGYISISHVWDPGISDTQARGRHSPQDMTVRQRLFSSVLSIAHGFTLIRNEDEAAAAGKIEIWHDYFSVP